MTSKQKIIFTGTLVALLASIILVLQQRKINELESRIGKETPSVSAPGPNGRLRADIPSVSQSNTSPDQSSSASDDAKLARKSAELEAAQAKLDQLSRPFTESIFSSVVKTELGMDEVLVVGGFPLENGNYQFTFLSPEPAPESEGRETINITSRLIELTPDALAEAGLDGLATNAKNTLQHAEAWKRDEVEVTMSRLAEESGASVIASPSVRTFPGADVTVSIGTFSLDLAIENRDTDPGYLLTTRIEMADTLPSGENPSTPD